MSRARPTAGEVLEAGGGGTGVSGGWVVGDQHGPRTARAHGGARCPRPTPPRCEHHLPASPRTPRPPRGRIQAFTQAAEDRKPVRIRRGPATVTRHDAATRAGPGVRH
ncbi:hypothetical protein GCM10010295_19360 [Streptomyces intermedius]